MNEKIDFESHTPSDIQLIDILKDAVRSGVWAAGDQITGQQELSDLYRVSRTVVRQALRELQLGGSSIFEKARARSFAFRKSAKAWCRNSPGSTMTCWSAG